MTIYIPRGINFYGVQMDNLNNNNVIFVQWMLILMSSKQYSSRIGVVTSDNESTFPDYMLVSYSGFHCTVLQGFR